MSTKPLWVFGYGSLLWAPGFKYTGKMYGTVKGYSRKFWQGNTTHRGRPLKPGRVATLVEDKNSDVWGVAYEIDSSDAIAYLENREVRLGGYKTVFTLFHPSESGEPFMVLFYVANQSSCHWLGEAPEEKIAEQILESSGPSGHNVEYLIRLAEFVRNEAPRIEDEHLFLLEKIVRTKIKRMGLDVDEFMGLNPLPFDGPTHEDEIQGNPVVPTHQFAASITSNRLRCLRM